MLKRTHNFQDLIRYKQAPSKFCKTIPNAKRKGWQSFCNKIGRLTPVRDIWSKIKNMRGIKREWQYPVLNMGKEAAVCDKDEAEMIAKALIKI